MSLIDYVLPFLNHASVTFASVCATLLALLLAAVLYILLYKVRVVAIFNEVIVSLEDWMSKMSSCLTCRMVVYTEKLPTTICSKQKVGTE